MDRFYGLFDMKGSATIVLDYEPSLLITLIPEGAFAQGLNKIGVWKSEMVAKGYKPEVLDMYCDHLRSAPIVCIGCDNAGNMLIAPKDDPALPGFVRNEILDANRFYDAACRGFEAVLKKRMLDARASGKDWVWPKVGAEQKPGIILTGQDERVLYVTEMARYYGLPVGDSLPEYVWDKTAPSGCTPLATSTVGSGGTAKATVHYYPINYPEIRAFAPQTAFFDPLTFRVASTRTAIYAPNCGSADGSPVFYVDGPVWGSQRVVSALSARTSGKVIDMAAYYSSVRLSNDITNSHLSRLASLVGASISPVLPSVSANCFSDKIPTDFRCIGIGLKCSGLGFPPGAFVRAPFPIGDTSILFARPDKIYLSFPGEIFTNIVDVWMSKPERTAADKAKGLNLISDIAPYSAQTMKFTHLRHTVVAPSAASHGLDAYHAYAKMRSRMGKSNDWDTAVRYGKTLFMGQVDKKVSERGRFSSFTYAPSMKGTRELIGNAYELMNGQAIPWRIVWSASFVPSCVDSRGEAAPKVLTADEYRCYLLRGYPGEEVMEGTVSPPIPMNDDGARLRFCEQDPTKINLATYIANLKEESDVDGVELSGVSRPPDFVIAGYVDPTALGSNAAARAWLSQGMTNRFYEQIPQVALVTGSALIGKLVIIASVSGAVMQVKTTSGGLTSTPTNYSSSFELSLMEDVEVELSWVSGDFCEVLTDSIVPLTSPVKYKVPKGSPSKVVVISNGTLDAAVAGSGLPAGVTYYRSSFISDKAYLTVRIDESKLISGAEILHCCFGGATAEETISFIPRSGPIVLVRRVAEFVCPEQIAKGSHVACCLSDGYLKRLWTASIIFDDTVPLT